MDFIQNDLTTEMDVIGTNDISGDFSLRWVLDEYLILQPPPPMTLLSLNNRLVSKQ